MPFFVSLGATDGIGTETTHVLALHGVHVVMAVRTLKEIPTAKVDVMELDLSSLSSVRQFATKFLSSSLPLNILINNAGAMAPPFVLSKNKIELQFATNHLGHFLLTQLLLETMRRTLCEQNKEGRIANVSSKAHRFAYKGIYFDHLNNKSSYNTVYAYAQSKLANILHAKELTKHFKEYLNDDIAYEPMTVGRFDSPFKLCYIVLKLQNLLAYYLFHMVEDRFEHLVKFVIYLAMEFKTHLDLEPLGFDVKTSTQARLRMPINEELCILLEDRLRSANI
ncbi:hypothetical protein R6Q59_026716 [Mikania micrantha]